MSSLYIQLILELISVADTTMALSEAEVILKWIGSSILLDHRISHQVSNIKIPNLSSNNIKSKSKEYSPGAEYSKGTVPYIAPRTTI